VAADDIEPRGFGPAGTWRHIRGRPSVSTNGSGSLAAEKRWRTTARKRIPGPRRVRSRALAGGTVGGSRMGRKPDLKHGRGGLRTSALLEADCPRQAGAAVLWRFGSTQWGADPQRCAANARERGLGEEGRDSFARSWFPPKQPLAAQRTEAVRDTEGSTRGCFVAARSSRQGRRGGGRSFGGPRPGPSPTVRTEWFPGRIPEFQRWIQRLFRPKLGHGSPVRPSCTRPNRSRSA